MEPNFYDGHLKVGLALLYQKQNKAAITELQLAVKLTGERDAASLEFLGFAYGVASEKSKALEILQKIKALPISENEKVNYYATIYTGLEDWDRSIELSHQAVNNHLPDMLLTKAFTQNWIPEMMDDPRYKQLFESIDSKIK